MKILYNYNTLISSRLIVVLSYMAPDGKTSTFFNVICLQALIVPKMTMWEKVVAILINGEVEYAKGMKCYRISVTKPLRLLRSRLGT